jgi:hypothetical protein
VTANAVLVKVVHLAHSAYLKTNTTSVGMLSLGVILRKKKPWKTKKTLMEMH